MQSTSPDSESLALLLRPIDLRARTRIGRWLFNRMAERIESNYFDLVCESEQNRKWSTLEQHILSAGTLSGRDGIATLFMNSDLRAAAFVAVVVNNMDFSHANLIESDWRYSSCKHTAISSCLMAEAVYRWSDLSDVDMSSCNLSHADFSGASLRNVSFEGSDLSNASFRGCNLYNVNLSSSMLVGSDFSGARLHDLDIRGAELDETNFSYSKCSHWVVPEVKLEGGNFYNCRWNGSRRHDLPSTPPSLTKKHESPLADSIARIRRWIPYVKLSRIHPALRKCMFATGLMPEAIQAA